MTMPLPKVEQRPSPNHSERAAGKLIDILLFHYTGMESDEGALKWLCDPRSKVSSHYFVGEDGRIVQLVDEARRAWHAGQSSWAGEVDINSRSVGIEVGNPGHEYGYRPFPPEQIAALIPLCHGILARHPISPARVLAHSDVAPTRKSDPGELFPWEELYGAGIGLWVPPEPPGDGPALQAGDCGAAVVALRVKLARYGYGIEPGEAYDAETWAVVAAFQRHFRPERVDGIADPSTVATLDRLIAAAG